MRTERDRSLEVTLTRGTEAPCFATVSGISIRYRGTAETNEKRALAVLTRLLKGLAARIPDDLESNHRRGLETMPPHRALAFAFPYCTAERGVGNDGEVRIDEVLIRLTGRCNQECPFCSAPPPLSDPPPSSIEHLLDILDTTAPTATVTLTGGEPTLRKDLADLVRRALAPGRDVEIQTNAVRLADPSRIARYPESSHLRFFVSLHALDEAVYDRCTGTTGMMPRAIEGIRNLQARGHPIVLSVVASKWNAALLEETVESVAELFTGPPLPSIHFSSTLCAERRAAEAERCLIRYSELSTLLEAAYERARKLGLHPEPLLSSTHAAIPACFLKPRFRRRTGPLPLLETQGAETSPDDFGWRRGPRCGECSFSPACPGVPAAYAARFGLDELNPIVE